MKEGNLNNLTKALAVISLLAPAKSFPLSIGSLELHSALNQKLKAEIILHTDAGENPADISVRLAAPDQFDQAGIPWSYFLSKIKFETVESNGSLVIKLSSKDTLTEPFLDMLLEVSWPSGKQFKEFTVLLDPPSGYNNQPAPPVIAESRYEAASTNEPERPVVHKPRITKHYRQEETGNQPVFDNTNSSEFGPVTADTTLWSIAKQYSDERGVSTKQMMSAILAANPDAFQNHDANLLKKGAILRIPGTTGALASQSLPRKQVQTAVNQKPSQAQTPENNQHLKLLPPTEAKIPDNAVTTNQIRPAGSSSTSEAEAKVAEYQSRVEKLEEQLDSMQKLLSLKDRQLAELQNAAKPPVNTAIPATISPPTVTPQTQQPVVAGAQNVDDTAKLKPQAPPVVQPTPKPPIKVNPTPPPAKPEEDFFSSDIFTYTLAGLGTGLLIVLGWIFKKRRSTQEQSYTESMFARASQITMPDTEANISVPVLETVYDVGTVGESSFISDFTPSHFEDFDTDQSEVDPLSEADVYLAYGRYQQAEDLIRTALSQEPGRDSLKLKLLEIFYASENKQAFADYSEALAAEGKSTDKAFWGKVVEMAAEIIPDSELFGGHAIKTEHPEIEADSVSQHVATEDDFPEFRIDDEDFNLSSNNQPTPAEFNADKTSQLVDLEDDLSLNFDISTTLSDLEKSEPESVANSLNFDQTELEANELSFNVDQNETDARSLEFHTDFSAQDAKTAPKLSKPAELDIEALNIDSVTYENEDLSDAARTIDFDFKESSNASPSEKPQDANLTGKSNSLDLEFNSLAFDENLSLSDDAFDPKSDHPVEKLTGIESTSENIAKNDLEAQTFSFDKLGNTDTENQGNNFSSFDFNFDFDPIENLEEPQSATPKPDIIKIEDEEESNSEFLFNFDFDTPLQNISNSEEFDLSVSDLTDMDEFETKIDLAKAYVDMGDAEAAKSIAQEVLLKGSKEQQLTAKALLEELKQS